MTRALTVLLVLLSLQMLLDLPLQCILELRPPLQLLGSVVLPQSRRK